MGLEASIQTSFPEENSKQIAQLNHFAVEHIKDARRLLVKYGMKYKIDESQFIELNKHTDSEQLLKLLTFLKEGHSIGMISDAGCPGIADPGAELAQLGHQHGFEVIPLVGPSSILLALIASGLNGQSFTFHGYLNRDKAARSKQFIQLEFESRAKQQTQIFMETPYRNDAIIADLLQSLNKETKLCIAADISLLSQYIKTKTIGEWKKFKVPTLNKRPAIFLILA